MTDAIDMSDDRICYCFGWAKHRIADELEKTGSTKALHDIRFKMKTQGCSCTTLNPSGKCCLPDIKQFIKQKKEAIS